MRKKFESIFTAVMMVISIVSCASAPPTLHLNPKSTSAPQSVNVIKFGNANTLFVGDSKSAMLYAYTIVADHNPTAEQGYNIIDLNSKIAAFAKISPSNILIRDMAIHPISKEAFIAFDTKTTAGYTSKIVIVNQTGTIKDFDLVSTKHTAVQIHDAPTSDVKFWGKTSMRSLTFTDIDYYKGKVYISGMSNAEFSSALRYVDYPFAGSELATSSVEIFHAVHGQNETRAPIQTLSFVSIDQEDYILAAYTCTPLVLIPMKELKDGAHITGKTIAELGYGNTPIDMIKFKSAGFDKIPYEGIILSNRNRTAKFINLKDIANSSYEDGVAYGGFTEHIGTPVTNLPMAGLMQLDDQDDSHIAAIRRDNETGNLELVSFLKNAYLRLDEFIAEYDMPSYKYEGQQLQAKEIQNMLIKDIGLQEFIKE